jgi:hypothetical protein
MIRSIALTFVFPCIGVVICFGSQDQDKPLPGNLILRIAAKETTLTQGQQPQITVTISNKGKMPLTLVYPGDGSESAWRTPVIGWSAIKVGKEAANHPQIPPLYRGGRCGNINRLKKEEVFVLTPDESKQLNGWIAVPQLAAPGTYSVVFYFANDPALKWRGLPLGQHDPEAMIQVQKSHKCLQVSNELKFVVNPKE